RPLIAKLERNIYDIFPPLSEEQFNQLKADIAARGVMVPIELDRNGEILDGKHRLLACTEAGFQKVPVIIRSLLAGEQAIEHILRLHFARRQLPKAAKKKLTVRLRKEGWTEERIAHNLGVSQQTISNWLQFTNFGEVTKVIGKDGKLYPTKGRTVKRK